MLDLPQPNLDKKVRKSVVVSFLHLQIGEVAKPLILEWVIAQNSRILEWTGRVFDLEVGSILSNGFI